MRKTQSFTLTDNLKQKVLHWGSAFKYCAYFNPNSTKQYPFSPFYEFIGVADQPALVFNGEDDFEKLSDHLKTSNDWLIGHLSYDLKNQVEKLKSSHKSVIDFGLGNFFVPDHLIFFENQKLIVKTKDHPKDIYDQICNTSPKNINHNYSLLNLQTHQEKYTKTASRLIDHIYEGDIYEINYCIQYIVEDLNLDPVLFYHELCKLSPTPFSVFYKLGDKYAMGASPERFLKKTQDLLISQPIKGTAKRGKTEDEDKLIKDALSNDEKERAENMMIVDLVRNDLSKSAKTGTVKVEEMFGIYTFMHWHQMISTVSAQKKNDINIADILKNAFPMGSMTGAPKVKVMQLIEKYENFKRGLYSGAIGYITPDGDFDFNVVIRTLFYDQIVKKGTFMVGSAITSDAEPEKEFEECLLKARPIIEALNMLCKNQPENS